MPREDAKMKSLVFAFLVAVFLHNAIAHPQCLDFKPPFRPSGDFELCTEYKSFGCCTAEDDAKLLEQYKQLTQNITESLLTSCDGYLKTLLCQKCSPYAAHIYESEGGSKPKTFPALCRYYCNKFMKTCSPLVEMITDEERLITLSTKNTKAFCTAVKASDPDYCYPKLKSNFGLNNGLGTEMFYRQKNPFNPAGTTSSCMRMCVEEVANGLFNPLSLKHGNDGTHRLFVVEQVGIVWVYMSDWSRLSIPFLNLRDMVLVTEQSYDERGMLDIAFHPNFKENGQFYLFYTILIRGNHHIKISEMKVSNTNMNRGNLSSERTLLTVQEPAFNHNGGQLIFGIDGYLYIFIGDGGGAGDPFGEHGNGQNKKTLLGKVLRIDVDTKSPKGKPYGIPADNPFVGKKAYLPEIYALGVRNMWRCGMDRGNETGHNRGRIFCGDVGQSRFEEIDIIKKGGNYGWRAYEGFSCYDRKICNKKFVKNYVKPIHVYSHAIGKSVTGGYVYRGCQNPNLKGKYIFGDFVSGNLFLLKELPSGKWRKQNICMGNSNVCKGGLSRTYAKYILSFGEDENGELYMLSTHDPTPGRPGGRIYRLVDPSRRGDPSICASDVTTETIVAKETKIIPYKGNT